MKKLISIILVTLLMMSCVGVTAFAAASDDVIDIARQQIGAYGSDDNKFSRWFYGETRAAPWCAMFVSWCADEAGVMGSAVPKRGNCQNMMDWFIERDEYFPADSGYVPVKGDIIFFDTDGSSVAHHVEYVSESGFMEENGELLVMCIGGNTTDSSFNGADYVAEKKRPVNNPEFNVLGYAHPDYETAESFFGKLFSFDLYAFLQQALYAVRRIIDMVFGTGFLAGAC